MWYLNNDKLTLLSQQNRFYQFFLKKGFSQYKRIKKQTIGNLHKKLTLFLITASLFCITQLHSEELDASWTSNLQTFRPLILPRNESTLQRNQSRLRFNVGWMNIWSLQDDRFLIDGEEVRFSGTWRKALTRHIQAGIQFSVIHQSGGVLDSPIETFHRGVGVTQGQRDNYQRDKFSLSYEPYGKYYPLFDNYLGESFFRRYTTRNYPRRGRDKPFDFDTNDSLETTLKNLILKKLLPETEVIPIQKSFQDGVGDPKVFLQSTIFRSNHLLKSIHLGLEGKIPAHGGDFLGSSGLDGSISLTGTFNWTDTIESSFGISWTAFSLRKYAFIDLPSDQWILRPSISWKPDTWEFFMEYLYFTKPTVRFGELAKPGHQVALGGRRQTRQGMLTIAFIENMVNYGVTPDIVFKVGHEWKL